MTHNDYQCLQEIRFRWQKEQQLIRKKYEIPFNITYRFRPCVNNVILPKKSLHEQKVVNYDNNVQMTKDRLEVNSVYITKTNSSHTQSKSCSNRQQNDAGQLCKTRQDQFWNSSIVESRFTNKASKISSWETLHERSVTIDSSFSSKQRNSKQYALLDLNSRQSLLNYIQTIDSNKKFSYMTIEQLRQRITNDENIHVFHSLTDLVLSMTREERENFLYHVYVDPSFYSMMEGRVPLCRSQLIADNRNLKQVLYTIEKTALLLGVKIDQPFNNKTLPEKISIRRRTAILNELSHMIASKIPDKIFRTDILHTQ